jgi:hypothetical protein
VSTSARGARAKTAAVAGASPADAGAGASPSADQTRGAESRVETARLARLLGLDGPHAIDYLHAVPAKEIAAYREAVIEALYDEGREQLQRAADAARLLPARVLAKVGELALGPLICARLSALIDPGRAAEIAEHFSIGFLARLASELDPRRAVDVLSALPGHLVVAIAAEMASRGEQVAMGRFVAHLDRATLAACIEELSDVDVIRVAFVADGAKPHGHIFEAAGVARIRAALDAAEAAGLDEEARYFVEHLSASQRKRLGAREG